MAKAIGIGGIFIKYKDPAAMGKWFREALGLQTNDYGVLFRYNNRPGSNPASLQFGTFASTSKYFGKEEQQVMINFRVDNLEELEKHLRNLGTVICNEIQSYDYGKFLHIEDPEGNRIELWEPMASSSDFADETGVDML